ncbi:hypothetical protein SSBR45G_27040 [Bradyrhizobium sp. SSBR45G]|uniref:hypothetical protein n=1 Tax=unclassified Bradyrhizobium TaxID=2631580 RepID=UPI0023429B43|nr:MULTISPECIES: hypothetical protein [unclassified Bradyrhizobium]GLH77796.1 hypothetical protein SSBR45G_27040 [Bradyrhizobium sp. SSBR45G]GLH85583.1 hypothetical protein SSBR45R_30430 [Bradyrhizobium sp. SSBR45R]
MRGVISGLVAIVGLAVAGSAPAAACGASACAPCGYASPCAPTVAYQPTYSYQPAYTYHPGYTYGHTGCGSCGVSYERLPEPTRQYYYVNQGPTYSGPGAFAPYPAYEERAIPVYRYHHRHHAYEETRVAPEVVYAQPQHAYRWGASPYYHGRRVLRRYY